MRTLALVTALFLAACGGKSKPAAAPPAGSATVTDHDKDEKTDESVKDKDHDKDGKTDEAAQDGDKDKDKDDKDDEGPAKKK
jgi:hypothetical protein